MVRIGGGVFPDIKEKDYLGEGGYRVDDKAGKVRKHLILIWVVLPASPPAEQVTLAQAEYYGAICALDRMHALQAAVLCNVVRLGSIAEARGMAAWPMLVQGLTAFLHCLQALLDCLMYKMSYYRYAEAAVMTTGQYGYDRVRNVAIGRPDIELEYFEEVSICLCSSCTAVASFAEPGYQRLSKTSCSHFSTTDKCVIMCNCPVPG